MMFKFVDDLDLVAVALDLRLLVACLVVVDILLFLFILLSTGVFVTRRVACWAPPPAPRQAAPAD